MLDLCNEHHLAVCKPCAEAGSWTRADLHPGRDALHLPTDITIRTLGVCSQTSDIAACTFAYDPWSSLSKPWEGDPIRVAFRVEERGPERMHHCQTLARAEIRAVVAAKDWKKRRGKEYKNRDLEAEGVRVCFEYVRIILRYLWRYKSEVYLAEPATENFVAVKGSDLLDDPGNDISDTPPDYDLESTAHKEDEVADAVSTSREDGCSV
ncbi:hypothetical protein ACEPPN_000248 [Leptodophora sp. 'Broadleaf-Isolate-01']